MPSALVLRCVTLLLLAQLVSFGCGSRDGTEGAPSAEKPQASAPPASSTPPVPPKGSSPAAATIPELGASTVEAIRFVDEHEGWMIVSNGSARGLWNTGDGGETWTRKKVPVTPYGLEVSPGSGRLWVVGTEGNA